MNTDFDDVYEHLQLAYSGMERKAMSSEVPSSVLRRSNDAEH